MKYEAAASFLRDFRKLSRAEKDMFREAVLSFAAAAEAVAQGGRWPKALPVKDVQSAPGIWEMTWSFSGPDGRATFEWIDIEGEPAIRWRRIGGHAIFKDA